MLDCFKINKEQLNFHSSFFKTVRNADKYSYIHDGAQIYINIFKIVILISRYISEILQAVATMVNTLATKNVKKTKWEHENFYIHPALMKIFNVIF